MSIDREGVLTRLRAALPESRADVDRIAAEIAAEGLSDELLEFVLEGYTWAILGRRPKAPEPDLLRWRRWVAFVESEYGRDAGLDATIDLWFFTQLHSLAKEDPFRLRDAFPTRLGAAFQVYLAKQAKFGPRPDPVTDAFLIRLAEQFPELQTYIEDNRDDDQLLRHMIFDDVARHVTDLCAEGGDAVRHAQEIIDAIEAGYGRSDSLDMAIATGFVEALPYSHEPHAAVTELLGPRLLRVWQGDGPASTDQ
jgi:hypothetical protein